MASKRITKIRVDGTEISGLYEDLIALEVCDQVEGTSSFSIKIAIHRKPDGTWTRLDDASSDGGISLWQRVTIEAGFDGNSDVLIDGYVAGIEPCFLEKAAESFVLIWGYDASFAMDQEEKIVTWPDVKYSDVAKKLFGDYSLTPQIEETDVLHSEANQLLLQRCTDWQFLKILAERVGFEVYVIGGKGYFRPPLLTGTPQKDLAVNFGPIGTNVMWFRPKVVGHLPSKVQTSRINLVAKQAESVEITTSPLNTLAGKDGDALRADKKAAGKPNLVLRPIPVTDKQEMEAIATGVRRRADWIVSAEGELDGHLYGRALKARSVVLVKGVGRTWSGLYYVTRVLHTLTPINYCQRFSLVRNGATLSDSERFQSVEAADQESDSQSSGTAEKVETRQSGSEVAP